MKVTGREWHMSLGDKLRQEREKRGVTLAQIAQETRIGTRYLEALEKGDTQTLPRDFFYRSFVRQYASYLGMSDAEIATALELEMGRPAPAETIAAATPAPVETPSVTFRLPRPEWRRSASASPSVFMQESRTSSAWLALAGLLLAASISYLAWDRMPWNRPATQSSSTAVRSAETQPPVQEAATVTTTSGTTTVEATNLGSGTLKIVISAKEKTWIQLDADGRALFVGLLEPGQSRAVENATQAKLLTGNAAGIDVQQNGRSLPGLGERGQVKTVVFTKEAYQVLTPQTPKPTAEDPAPAPPADSSGSSPVA